MLTGSGGRDTPYNELYGDVPPKRGTIFRPRYGKGVPFPGWRLGRSISTIIFNLRSF